MLPNISWLMARGPRYFADRVYAKFMAPKAKSWPLVRFLVANRGSEVGGPGAGSNRGGLLPIYPIVRSLDCCNFGPETIWEGSLKEGLTFRYGDRIGQQYISEAWALPAADATYDFVASCHMLEHTANPMRVLFEWHRVL